jgi:hypothetical protein
MWILLGKRKVVGNQAILWPPKSKVKTNKLNS